MSSIESHLSGAIGDLGQEVPFYRHAGPRYHATLQVLNDELGSVRSVAEVGPSPLTVALARAGYDATVYGMFRSPAEEEGFRKAGVAIRPWDLLETAAPAEAEVHDLVLFLEIIEHLALYPATVFERVSALVAEDGYLVVSTPDLHRLKNKARLLLNRPLFGPFVKTDRGQYHVREYGRSELLQYLRMAGFEPVRTGRFGPFGDTAVAGGLRQMASVTKAFTTHFWVVCRKAHSPSAVPKRGI